MGHAMLRPWVKAGIAQTIYVVAPRLESLHGLETEGVRHVPFPQNLPADIIPDAIVFAVKPQIAAEVVPAYAKVRPALFLSVIAGKKLAFYETALGHKTPIIRAMPNLPAKVGKGATLLCANAEVSDPQKKVAQTLLSVLGTTLWLDHEDAMDAATALSGCGPAYFYYMAEALAEAGRALGLPAQTAATLARQTLIGSASLWEAEPQSAAMLYQSIAVKGGMTEAALAILQERNSLKNMMKNALLAAVTRAKNLAG